MSEADDPIAREIYRLMKEREEREAEEWEVRGWDDRDE